MEMALSTLKYGAFDYVVKNDEAMERIIALMERLLQVRTVIKKHYRSKRLTQKVVVGALVLASICLACFTLL